MRRLSLLLVAGIAWGQQGPEADYRRAWQLAGQGRVAEAIPILRKVAESSGSFAPAYRLLAEAYHRNGSTAEGEQYFRGQIALNPTRGDAHYGLALLLGSLSRSQEALREASECARTDPSLFECWDMVAFALSRTGGSSQTLDELGRWIPLTTGGAEAAYAVFAFHHYQLNFGAAVAAGEQAITAAAASGKTALLAAAEYKLATVIAVSPGPDVEKGRRSAEQACRHGRGGSDPEAEFDLCTPVSTEIYAPACGSAELCLLGLIARASEVGNPGKAADLENSLALILASGGRVQEALEHMEKAASLSALLGRATGLTNQLRSSGELYMRIGMQAKATESFEKALDAAELARNTILRAHVLAKLTVAYSQAGNALAAIRTAEEAVRLFRENALDWQAGAELSDVGMAYLILGDTGTAIRYFRESLESGRRFKDSGEMVRNTNLLAEALLARGQAGEAEKLLKQIVSLLAEIREAQFEVRTRTLLGEAHSRMKEYGEAEREFEAALGLVRGLKNAWAEADLLQRMGRHWLRAGDVAGAEKSFEACLVIADAASMVKLSQEARLGLAEAARRRGQPERALVELRKAVIALESVRSMAPGPELRAGLLRRNWEVYASLIDTLDVLHRKAPRTGYDREALTMSERGRARVLLDLLEESRAGVGTGLTAEQASRQQALERRLAAALEKLRAAQNPATRAGAEAAERELAQWATDLRIANPRYHELKYPEPLTAEGIRKLAAERGLTIVEYSLGRRASRVWVAARGELRSASLPPEAVVARLAGRLRGALEKHPAGAVAEAYREPARELYRVLLEPVEALLEAGDRVVIVPDGILHYLPFEALVDRRGKFLVERAAVSYAPSASVFAQLGQSAAAGGGRELFALGNPDFGGKARTDEGEVVRGVYDAAGLNLRPLPGTEREVRSIAALFPGRQSRVLLGAAASEAAMKQEALASYRRLHLATHALIDEQAPARSGIVLSLVDRGKEDGVLQIHEIMGLRLNADVVTLSACQTGLGTLVRGEGMVGFTRAFLFAGARQLAVSLWPVNDRVSPELMGTFYKGMQAGARPAEALRGAKLEMLKSGVAAYRHPYFWAGFVVVGGR